MAGVGGLPGVIVPHLPLLLSRCSSIMFPGPVRMAVPGPVLQGVAAGMRLLALGVPAVVSVPVPVPVPVAGAVPVPLPFPVALPVPVPGAGLPMAAAVPVRVAGRLRAGLGVAIVRWLGRGGGAGLLVELHQLLPDGQPAQVLLASQVVLLAAAW